MKRGLLVGPVLAAVCTACASPGSGGYVDLQGYLVVVGGQATLYDDEAAAKTFELGKCVDVFAYRRQLASLRRRDETYVSLKVVEIEFPSTPPDEMSGMIIFDKINVGRYCKRNHAYLLIKVNKTDGRGPWR